MTAYLNEASRRPAVEITGRVRQTASATLSLTGLSPFARVGDIVAFEDSNDDAMAEIVHLDEEIAIAIPHQKHTGVALGSRVKLVGRQSISPDKSWLGRVIDPLGRARDGLPPPAAGKRVLGLDRAPPPALDRNRVEIPLRTGVKAIDAFTPLCRGQRIGVFAGSGVGKSTLLAMLADLPDASVIVLALVGERGREVREFLEDILGNRRHRVVAVVSTSDDSAAVRRMAPKAAMSVAEYFRDLGEHVVLMVDSMTRFAHAQREYALAAGEPAVSRGYPPSAFAEIAKVLERAGPGPIGLGDITAIITVLVDGDDHNDPVSDAIRGMLDGHIVLDRKIAATNRWPAIDLISSLSRLSSKAWSAHEQAIAKAARSMVSRYEDTRDLRLIGGYQTGSDPELDAAVALVPRLYELLKQDPSEREGKDVFGQIEQVLRLKQPV